MTVAELIDKLREMPQDLPVFTTSLDDWGQDFFFKTVEVRDAYVSEIVYKKNPDGRVTGDGVVTYSAKGVYIG